MTLGAALGVVPYAIAGVAVGAIFFGLLALALRRWGSDVKPLNVLVLFAVRFGGAAAVFWLIAHQGAGPLVAALAGFLVARFAVQRSLRPEV